MDVSFCADRLGLLAEERSPDVASIHLFSGVPIMSVAILVRLRILCLSYGREGWSLPQSDWHVEIKKIKGRQEGVKW